MNKIYYWGAEYKKQIQFVLFVIAICVIIFSKKELLISASEGFILGSLLINLRDGFLYIRKKYKQHRAKAENI